MPRKIQQVFTQQYGYHAQTGQLKSQSYPNGLTVAYEYNAQGYAQRIKNAASGYVYRHISAQDAFGHITDASLGNGVMESRSYDAGTGWVQALNAVSGGVTVHQLSYSQYDSFGNLKYYSNNATNVSESYNYDDVHRLIQSTTSGAGVSVGLSYGYDAAGNMLSKSDYASNYQYGNTTKTQGGNAGPNAVRQVTKSGGSVVNFSYDNEGNLLSGDGLTISYTSFKQPTTISRSGNSFSFGYGARLERVKETRNGLTTYEIDKAYEKSSDGSWKLYLDDVAIISQNSTDGHRIAYSHKDRLGSSVTFTDHNGQVTGRRHYDAFGKPRVITGALMEPAHRPKQLNFTDFAGVDNASITRRGFTDHRHLDEAELIHMNGRGYDYNLGRFLSVDPVIQSPGNSQSLNPYSYIMNNPLAGTDPTGYMGCAASKIDSVCESTSSNYGGYSESFNASQGALTNKVSNALNNMFTQGNGAKPTGTTSGTTDGTSKSMDLEKQNANGKSDPLTNNINQYAQDNKYVTKSKGSYSTLPIDESNLDANTTPYNQITLHHTGGADTPKEVEDLHRGNEGIMTLIRQAGDAVNLSQAYNNADVGYHFMISEDGVIFEGRSLQYAGAHAEGHNQGNIGIAFLGDYTDKALTRHQVGAATQLINRLKNRYDLSGDFIKTHGQFNSDKHKELQGAMRQVDMLRRNLQ